jgi:hypothetical protein
LLFLQIITPLSAISSRFYKHPHIWIQYTIIIIIMVTMMRRYNVVFNTIINDVLTSDQSCFVLFSIPTIFSQVWWHCFITIQEKVLFLCWILLIRGDGSLPMFWV